ncbi:MAG: cell division protein FtsQ/DivIB [Hominenteromicrobium sp.]
MAEAPERSGRRSARGRSPKDRRARGRALIIFYITAFSAVVIGAVLLCIFVFFKVGEVQITGDAGYDEADILRICGIQTGDNLVLLSTKEREAELEHRFPYIENVRIIKHIPSTVEIEITPAETCFSVESKQGYLYVSRSGKVLEVASSPCPESTVVRGCTPTATGPSQQIGFEEETAEAIFREINSQLDEEDVAAITDIDLRNQYDITMTYDDRIVFRFGNMNDIAYKMAFGMKILEQMQEDGGLTAETRGEIDLTMVKEKNAGYFNEYIESSSSGTGEGTAGRSSDDTADPAAQDGGTE